MTRHKTKRMFIGTAVVLLSLNPLLAQGRGFSGEDMGQGRGTGRGGAGQGNGALSAVLESLPLEEISDDELQGLLLMREKEKLARDVYLALFDRYGLPDPANPDTPGLFQSTELQALYEDLIEKGSASFDEALWTGALIEDLDIFDLKRLLEKADNADIKTVYQNLMKGSRNHLRAFCGQLGIPRAGYTSSYLSSDDLTAILSSPMEHGFYDQDGNPLYGRADW